MPAASIITGVATPPTITVAARPAAGIIGNRASKSSEAFSLTKVTLSAGFDGLVTMALADSEVGIGIGMAITAIALVADVLDGCVEDEAELEEILEVIGAAIGRNGTAIELELLIPDVLADDRGAMEPELELLMPDVLADDRGVMELELEPELELLIPDVLADDRGAMEPELELLMPDVLADDRGVMELELEPELELLIPDVLADDRGPMEPERLASRVLDVDDAWLGALAIVDEVLSEVVDEVLDEALRLQW
ncbi:hypothetical protein N7517_002656 [Penicillium concentricum]|uniref:Uncharacterized protein n=1 Tax=Penicillium concentricum TaxID=293559 RepID=A0A9W9VLH8_9EURO|nr:uncharacterized protein N7517_002656 [Penicillium concentricum]KAJ5384745.1 hypothetical protein N7517_002656 [Penicillium concentricum]